MIPVCLHGWVTIRHDVSWRCYPSLRLQFGALGVCCKTSALWLSKREGEPQPLNLLKTFHGDVHDQMWDFLRVCMVSIYKQWPLNISLHISLWAIYVCQDPTQDISVIKTSVLKKHLLSSLDLFKEPWNSAQNSDNPQRWLYHYQNRKGW